MCCYINMRLVTVILFHHTAFVLSNLLKHSFLTYQTEGEGDVKCSHECPESRNLEQMNKHIYLMSITGTGSSWLCSSICCFCLHPFPQESTRNSLMNSYELFIGMADICYVKPWTLEGSSQHHSRPHEGNFPRKHCVWFFFRKSRTWSGWLLIHACSETGSARATYAERKAELSSVGQSIYDPTSPVNPAHLISYVSPRTMRRPLLRGGNTSG